MKRLSALFLILLAPATSQADCPDLILKASVRTEHYTQSAGTWQLGSGTVVKITPKGFYVLACCHTVEYGGGVGNGKLTITTWDNRNLPATVYAWDRRMDLSVIWVPGTAPVKAAALAESEKYGEGTAVIQCGYPKGERSWGRGSCAKEFVTNSGDPGVESFLATPGVSSGASGCGVFRASDLAVIGVVWGSLEGRLYARKVRDIHAFLKWAEVE